MWSCGLIEYSESIRECIMTTNCKTQQYVLQGFQLASKPCKIVILSETLSCDACRLLAPGSSRSSIDRQPVDAKTGLHGRKGNSTGDRRKRFHSVPERHLQRLASCQSQPHRQRDPSLDSFSTDRTSDNKRTSRTVHRPCAQVDIAVLPLSTPPATGSHYS